MSKFEKDEDSGFELPFNAVRFLAEALKHLGQAHRQESAAALPNDVLTA